VPERESKEKDNSWCINQIGVARAIDRLAPGVVLQTSPGNLQFKPAYGQISDRTENVRIVRLLRAAVKHTLGRDFRAA